MANITATNGNDILKSVDGDDSLTGGSGKDKFVYNLGDSSDIITDFSGVGKGSNPSAERLFLYIWFKRQILN